MAHLAKVEFVIHDANKKEPPPTRKTGRYGSTARPVSASNPSKQQMSQSSPAPGMTKGNNAGTSLTTNTINENSKSSKNNGNNSQTATPRTQKQNASTAPVSDFPVFDSTNFTSNTVHINRYHSSNNKNNSHFTSSFRPMSGGATTGAKFDHSPPPTRLSPDQRKHLHASHSGTIPHMERSNPAKRLPSPEEGFKFSAKPPDRDELRRQQDSKIGAYRSRHPELYDPPVESPKSPQLEKHACHHDVTHRITPRDRTVARSSRAHCHDPLPFYPFLRENDDHGIHKARWSVMSKPTDDPPRLRPETTGHVTKSHTDFEKWFHSDKWRSDTLASTGRGQNTMTIQRADLL